MPFNIHNAEIARPFYSREQNRRISTPERLHEHHTGYINKMTKMTAGSSVLIEVEAIAPS